MLTTSSSHGPLKITTWEQAPDGDVAVATLLSLRAGVGLRAAAITSLGSPGEAGCSGVHPSHRAAGVARAALASPLGPRDALQAANADLHESVGAPGSGTEACAISLDLTARSIYVIRAGGGQAWVKRGGLWRPLLVGDPASASAREALVGWRERHPEADPAEVEKATESILSPPSRWITTPLGRYPTARLQDAAYRGNWNALCVASGSSLPDPDALRHLGRWAEAVSASPGIRPAVSLVLIERTGPLEV